MMWEELDIHMQKKKMNLEIVLTLFTKFDSTGSMKHKTIKFLEDNIGENLHELRYDDFF